MAASEQHDFDIHIKPQVGWGFPNIREVIEYGDLLYFLVWRNMKIAYAQSIGGLAWAIVQPAMQVLIFSLVFGGLLELDTAGVPYPLFSTVAVVPWIYMSGAMGAGSNALVSNQRMLGKVYFPRLIFVMVPILSGLVSFIISLVLIVAVLLFYRVELTLQLLYLPIVFFLMVMTPFGVSLWLSSLAIRYRDVQIILGQLMRALIYLVPVMYPSEQIPEHLRSWYILNPFVGVVEGYRSCLLGQPMHWDSLISCAAICVLLVLTGAIYFRRMERIIVDVI